MSENTTGKNLSNSDKLRCQNNGNLKIYDFMKKLKKVVRIVLYGPAISQSDSRKAGPYQLPYNKVKNKKSKFFSHRYLIELYETNRMSHVPHLYDIVNLLK